MQNKKLKVISVEGSMGSGLKVLKVETDKGVKTIWGDHRMVDNIAEDIVDIELNHADPEILQAYQDFDSWTL